MAKFNLFGGLPTGRTEIAAMVVKTKSKNSFEVFTFVNVALTYFLAYGTGSCTRKQKTLFFLFLKSLSFVDLHFRKKV